MRVLFVGRAYPDEYRGGDRIYDEKLLQELRTSGAAIGRVVLNRQSTAAALVGAAKHYSLPTFFRYASEENAHVIREHSKGYDAAIISHEALAVPYLISDIELRTLFILHNLLGSIEGKSGVRGALSSRSKSLEQRLARKTNTVVGVLSVRELEVLRSWVGEDRVMLMPPGTPKPFSSVPTATVTDRIYVGGTADWGLKRRDYTSFLRYHKTSNLPPLGHEESIIDDGHLRIAIITDRFSTGFKLKASDLLRRNCAIISLSSVKADFATEVRPNESIIEVDGYDKIEAARHTILERRELITSEMQRLKYRFEHVLSWRAVADKAMNALRGFQMR